MHQTIRSSPHADFDVDLASLASQAAIALDNLVLNRDTELSAVRELADKVAAKLPSQSTMDLTTAVAVQHALIEMPGHHSTTVNEFLTNAADFTDRLIKIAASDSKDIDEAARLRTVCVALSRSAISLASPLHDRSTNPFRH